VYEVLSSFDSMWGSVDNMFADASQAVFKMQGLIESLATSDGEGKADVQDRLAFMDMVRSTAKSIMLDAGNKESGEEAESFEVVERSTLGTLDGVIQMYMIRLATAARMPLTVLLGMAPAGMDATGESDLVLYYNNVDIFRADELEPNFLRLVKMIARTLGDSDIDSWRLEWPELARPKPVDVATAEKMNTDAVTELVTAQALLPEEAALNLKRFAPNMRLRIDLKSRRKALADGLKELENREVGVGQLEAQTAVQTKADVAVAKATPKPAAGAKPAAKAGARATKASAAKRQT
jgi:phage-related protein (TIGR01555 family)